MSFIPLSKADIDKLEKERKEIDRRRSAEAERQKYFFNEKQRALGVDVDFIQTQIAEKENKKRAEKSKDRAHKQVIESFMDRLADLNENRQKFAKQKAFEVGEHQRKSLVAERDTFYLSDPSMIKHDKPPRINDTQYIPSCSLQKFDGEDLGKMKRIKKQQKEIEIWSKQMIDQKKKNEQNEKEAIATYVEKRDEYLNYLEAVQAQKNQFLKAETAQIAQSNIAQKQKNENEQRRQKKMESIASESEITQMKDSPFLNESWSSTLRDGDKNRFIPYNFKGFSQNQRQQILNEQSEQIQHHLDYAQHQKQKDEEFNKEQQNYSRAALLKLRIAQRFKEEQKMKLAQAHEAQIEETKIKVIL